MKVTDFNRLKKLMNMTHNENDGEALNALRMANKVLAGAGVDWDRVLNRVVSLDVEDAGSVSSPVSSSSYERSPSQGARSRHTEYLGQLLAEAAESAGGSFLDFVSSLQEQFDRTSSLSAAQVDALEKAVSRARRSSR